MLIRKFTYYIKYNTIFKNFYHHVPRKRTGSIVKENMINYEVTMAQPDYLMRYNHIMVKPQEAR